MVNEKDECLMARKPFSFEDLCEQIDGKITPEAICDMVRMHNVLVDDFEDWGEFYKANFSGIRWWRIVLKKEKVELLVDTQGYDYPRYVGILDKESTKFTEF